MLVRSGTSHHWRIQGDWAPIALIFMQFSGNNWLTNRLVPPHLEIMEPQLFVPELSQILGGVCSPPGVSTHPSSPHPPPENGILWGTVNKRAVRILLECSQQAGGTHPTGMQSTSGRYASYWNAVNKRAVRILLECVLVTLWKEKLVATDFVVSGVMTDGPRTFLSHLCFWYHLRHC